MTARGLSKSGKSSSGNRTRRQSNNQNQPTNIVRMSGGTAPRLPIPATPVSGQQNRLRNPLPIAPNLSALAPPRLVGALQQNTTLTNAASGTPVTSNSNLSGPYVPTSPNVTPEPLPFYDVITTIMEPTSLVASQPNSRVQEQSFYFQLSLDQANQISLERYKNVGQDRLDYPIQVQFRCFKMSRGLQQDAFPTGVHLKVNKQVAQLPPPIPSTKPNADPQRPGRPINITPHLRLSPTTPNHISFGFNYDHQNPFCVQLQLVRALTPQDLIQRIRVRASKDAGFTRNMIKQKLSPSDAELAVTDLHASLLCPVGKMRIIVPIRSEQCSHLQCLDAFCYLAMNERKPVWKCPYCDGAAPYNELYIDCFFLEVLDTASSDVEKVTFSEDGSWKAAIEERIHSHNLTNGHGHTHTSNSHNNHDKDNNSDAINLDLTLSDEEADVDMPPVATRHYTGTSDHTNQPTSNNSLSNTVDQSESQATDEPTPPLLQPEVITLDSSDDEQ